LLVIGHVCKLYNWNYLTPKAEQIDFAAPKTFYALLKAGPSGPWNGHAEAIAFPDEGC